MPRRPRASVSLRSTATSSAPRRSSRGSDLARSSRCSRGRSRFANDEDLLLKVAQLPAPKALKVVDVYMRGGKGEASASRLVEKYLHEHRLSGLTPSHESRLRGGFLVEARPDDAVGSPGDVRNVVLFGDALVHLRETLRPESVQTSITSPPFYGQRDFGTRHWFGGDPACKHNRRVAHPPFHPGQVPQTKYRTPAASLSGQNATTHSCSKCGAWYGQLGQEPDIGLYLDHMVTVFGEVRRVLRRDGVCWIEIGDTYNAGTNAPSPDSSSTDVGSWQSRTRTGRTRTDAPGVPAKSLLLVPQRLAVALQEDGWVVRAEIVVHKLTALPESVTDRPTRAHSTLLMLTKCPTYFYDAAAVLEAVSGGAVASSGRRGRKEARPGSGIKSNVSFRAATSALVESRNCRDVWSFVSGRFPEAHTATFPPALPERCIRASTSEHGACARCGAPWARVTVSEAIAAHDKQTAKFAAGRMRAARLGVSRDANLGASHNRLAAIVRVQRLRRGPLRRPGSVCGERHDPGRREGSRARLRRDRVEREGVRAAHSAAAPRRGGRYADALDHADPRSAQPNLQVACSWDRVLRVRRDVDEAERPVQGERGRHRGHGVEPRFVARGLADPTCAHATPTRREAVIDARWCGLPCAGWRRTDVWLGPVE